MTVDRLAKLLSDFETVDLTHPLEESMPIWPTLPPYLHTEWFSIGKGDASNVYQLQLNEHAGTHMDLPSHMIQGGKCADAVDPTCACGECITLDFSHLKPGDRVTELTLKQWEAAHEPIRHGDCVLLNLGYAKYWGNGSAGKAFFENWPGLASDGAEYLAARRVKLIGVDTLAIDPPNASDAAHHILLGQNIFIIENLAGLDQMPQRGYFVALPLMIEKGTGSPVRAIGLKERRQTGGRDHED